MDKKYSRVYVEITNVCNKSCSFCHGTKREPGFISTSQFEIIAQNLVGYTDYLYFHLMGEPLLHPDLKSLVSIASSLGFKTAITTNGTLLTERAEELLSSDLYKINISLHSFEDGTHSEFLKYIEGCVDFADKASSKGILTVLRLWNKGFDGGRNDEIYSIITERFGCEMLVSDRGARLRHRLHLEYGERFDWPDQNAEELGDRVFCHGLGDHFGILCDGSVVPCCLDSDGVMTLGNVLSTPLTEILESDFALAVKNGFREKRAVADLCRRCGYARRFKI